MANFRTNEGSSNNGEFVAAEMRMGEVSLRVIGSFASFATICKGREGKWNTIEEQKDKNSKKMETV